MRFSAMLAESLLQLGHSSFQSDDGPGDQDPVPSSSTPDLSFAPSSSAPVSVPVSPLTRPQERPAANYAYTERHVTQHGSHDHDSAFIQSLDERLQAVADAQEEYFFRRHATNIQQNLSRTASDDDSYPEPLAMSDLVSSRKCCADKLRSSDGSYISPSTPNLSLAASESGAGSLSLGLCTRVCVGHNSASVGARSQVSSGKLVGSDHPGAGLHQISTSIILSSAHKPSDEATTRILRLRSQDREGDRLTDDRPSKKRRCPTNKNATTAKPVYPHRPGIAKKSRSHHSGASFSSDRLDGQDMVEDCEEMEVTLYLGRTMRI
ncbi:hypothetical protein BV25DRAFT_140393 [Artomyces pyxidatus]|uniref:Uncharacterized protein n=1 Tax=Artomyces pyxidatus TaxID=48021 RepID=A0ACB8T979_9AGAM|nr:hypothetical protein BV25DRAFT_140393 [Artomyces pyxidatus]